jgi:hypothetical protein
MAILQGCPGVKVTIVSNDEALNEYPDEDTSFNHKDYTVPLARRAMTFIECISDAEFGIKWEITPEYKPDVPHTHLGFLAFIDGKRIGREFARVSLSGSWKGTLTEASDRVSDLEVISRKLMFKTIKKGK